MAAIITSLDGCPATITIPSSICQPDPTQVPTCENVTQDINCCNSWSSFASSEYACVSSHISCFTATGLGYADLCKSITGAGTGPTATVTGGPTTATGVTTTAAVTATVSTATPAPTKNGAARLMGTTRSISSVVMVLGVFVYLMA